MKFFLAFFLVTLSCCHYKLYDESKELRNIDIYDLLLYTFNDPACTNPCWLNIEAGITNKETTIAILEEYNIKFGLEGYEGHSIWLYYIPGGLFPDIAPGKFTRGWIYADDVKGVMLMDFDLDICVSTLIKTYGSPLVFNGGRGLDYLDHQVSFDVDPDTHRVTKVWLRTEEFLASAEDLEDWADYADTFSEECSDIFTEYETAQEFTDSPTE